MNIFYMPVFKNEDRKFYPVDWAYKTSVAILGATREKGFNYNMRHFKIEVGGYIPLHKHNKIFHLQYVLRGKMRLIIGDEEYIVGPGDVLYLPSGKPHKYVNIGDEPVEFLCITPLYADEMKLLEKVGE